MIRLLIVEDQKFARKAISTILNTESNFLVVGEAENGVQALELIHQVTIDIAIVDLDMPKMNGLELTKKINQDFPQIKVIILSGSQDRNSLNQVIRVGAKGYVLKDLFVEKEIINTINCVHHGYFQLGPGLSEKLFFNDTKDNNPFLLENSYTQNFAQLKEVKEAINIQCQQISFKLFDELNSEVSNLKSELQQGLDNFQFQVSDRIKRGFEDFSHNNSNQSQFIPEVWQKRYLNLAQNINFIESRYNLAIQKLQKEIIILRYCIFLLLIICIPILLDIFFSLE